MDAGVTHQMSPQNKVDCRQMTPAHSRLLGRDKEALAIQFADKASTLGRLMLGEVDSWEDYTKPAITDYVSLPRRQLKSGRSDVRFRLQKEINTFYSRNFVSFSDAAILALYEDIATTRGLEAPLNEFEEKYGTIRRAVLKGNPAHLTVSVTLWGLRFLFPEDLISKDILSALEILKESKNRVKSYESEKHHSLKAKTDEFLPYIRRIEFAQRSIVLSCFNLMEAYLNGLAWDYCQSNGLASLSNRKAKLLTDTSAATIRDKLTKYPAIIAGRDVMAVDGANEFLDIIKPFRDSLVHPSPFSAPEKFGGYQKLKKLYELDYSVSIMAVSSIVRVIKSICQLIYGSDESPKWLSEIECWLTENGTESN
ncbi:hypothetical protein [Accumulibacter sp.]|uniref:hypothetical protein n=1 Tax=Accumulibacter sp. TaxID=2053492 RepID=UPI002620850B|nr:hypothetical protein [Accumulibacter sp.]